MVADRRLADVFSIGALSYLVLTSKAPAANEAAMRERLEADSGLMISADVDSPLQALEDAIWMATSPRVHDRIASVDDYIKELDCVVRELNESTQDTGLVDPAEARSGDMIADDMIVLRKLGEGSTSIVLLIERDDGPEAVLKVARDDNKAERLKEEAETLARVPTTDLVARLIQPPMIVGGRTCLLIEQAGEQALSAEIARYGRLNLDRLRRWGRDLFEAAALLEGLGILHRDIKPANLGVRTRSTDGKPHLVLFDFSLAAAPVTDINAGTVNYRDPFLAEKARSRYDQDAELFTVAVTLHEMSTGRLPQWGDGRTDPAMLADEVTIDDVLFDPSVASGAADFFRQALARDAGKRFDNVQDMASAWDRVFESAFEETQNASEVSAQAATLETALENAGLSARALSALERYELVTVGDLLALEPLELSRIPGAAQPTKDEIVLLAKGLRARLLRSSPDESAASIDTLVRRVLDLQVSADADETRVVQFLLGQGDEQTGSGPVGWATSNEAQGELDLDREQVDAAWSTFVEAVSGSSVVDVIRRELADLLVTLEGVASADELTSSLLAAHGSHVDDPLRSAQAMALVRLAVDAAPADQRFAVRRRQSVVLIASGGEDGSADRDEALEAAFALAVHAESLALQASLPAPTTCLETLRAAATAPSLAGVSDSRLLSLAAAASGTAAVSARGEIYPRSMPAARALSLSRASLVSGGRPLSERTVQARVRARFPDATPLPGRLALDRLLDEADIDLTWKGDFYQSTSVPSSYTRKSSTMHSSGVGDDHGVIEETLRRSLSEAGFLAIAVSQRHASRVQARLESEFEVVTFDLSNRLLGELHADARTSGADWQFVLRADSLPAGDPTRQQLAAIVRTTAKRIFADLASVKEPALLVGGSVLARFGCVDVLAPLADLAQQRSAARWLLAPQTSATSPDLDGAPVPVTANGQWLTIPGAWVATPRHVAVNE